MSRADAALHSAARRVKKRRAAVPTTLFVVAARTYSQSRNFSLKNSDDVWAVALRVEPVMRERTGVVATDQSPASLVVRVRDEGGEFQAATVEEAYRECSGSRHALRGVRINAHVFASPDTPATDGFRLWISLRIENRTSGYALSLTVDSVDEAEAIGVADVLRREIEHAKDDPEAALAVQGLAGGPVAVDALRTSPIVGTTAEPEATVPRNQGPWFLSSSFWRNEWVVAIATGLIFAVAGFVFTRL